MDEHKLLRLPAAELGIVEVENGEIIVHLDRLEMAIKALPLVKMAEFVAGPAKFLREIAVAGESTVLHEMEKRGLKELPLGEGQKVVVKKSVSYAPLPEFIEELQIRLVKEGYKPGDNFPALAWDETIPARTERKFADVRALRKALALGGLPDPKSQDEALGRYEGKPRLSVETI